MLIVCAEKGCDNPRFRGRRRCRDCHRVYLAKTYTDKSPVGTALTMKWGNIKTLCDNDILSRFGLGLDELRQPRNVRV